MYIDIIYMQIYYIYIYVYIYIYICIFIYIIHMYKSVLWFNIFRVPTNIRATDIVPKASRVYTTIVTQGGNKANIIREIENIPKII